MRRSGFGFFHAGDLASLVGHSSGPDFLLIDRCQKADLVDRKRRGVGSDEKLCQAHRVRRVKDVAKLVAFLDLAQVERLHVVVVDRDDDNFSVGWGYPGESHEVGLYGDVCGSASGCCNLLSSVESVNGLSLNGRVTQDSSAWPACPRAMVPQSSFLFH